MNQNVEPAGAFGINTDLRETFRRSWSLSSSLTCIRSPIQAWSVKDLVTKKGCSFEGGFASIWTRFVQRFMFNWPSQNAAVSPQTENIICHIKDKSHLIGTSSQKLACLFTDNLSLAALKACSVYKVLCTFLKRKKKKGGGVRSLDESPCFCFSVIWVLFFGIFPAQSSALPRNVHILHLTVCISSSGIQWSFL